VRYLLVGTQIALAVVLLVGSGLLVKSLLLLQRRDAGFAVDDRVAMRLSLSGTAHEDRQAEYFRELVERVEALPGVSAAGVVNHLPIRGDLWRSSFSAEGDAAAAGDPPSASYRVTTPGYFEAMGIPLLRGRAFGVADAEGSPPVVLVNRTLAERLLPGRDPVGARIRLGGDEDPWLTVIGVVGDASQESLLEPVIPEVYYPYAQNPVGWFREGTLVAHASSAGLAAALRREANAIDPGVAVADPLLMSQVLAEDLRRERTNSWLLGVFAAIAVTLALVGLYGVISYLVGQRTHEMGVRVALGARAADITRMVLGESLAVTGAAVAVGLGLALLLTRLLVHMLYGVTATDPVIFAGVAVGIAAVATLAAAIPARRAARVDPMTALRGE
jgi:predicted permease